LTEEVLQCQTEDVQNFLLQTSILKRLSAPLCAAVVGQHTNTQALLEQLEKANLFIIPLDDERRWYRYHHLFADLLQSRLQELEPERVPELHRRAAGWYEQNGFVEDAIDHALAAKDFDSAVRPFEPIIQGLILRAEFITVQNWLDVMPDDVLRAHPLLGIGGAWALVLTNHLDEAERRVRDLEREIAVRVPDPGHNWTMELVVLQAAIASGRRDTPRTNALANQALEELPQDHVYRSVLGLYLGYAYQDRGEALLAQQAFAEAAKRSQAASLLVAMLALGNLGQQHVIQGHLRRAREDFEQALQLAARYGADSLPITGPSLVGIGSLLCEQNDLEAAERTIREGTQRSAQLGGVVVDVFSDYTEAQLKRAQGDIDGALQVIEQAEARLKSQSLMNRIPGLAAYRAQLWLAQRNPAAAAWAAEREREPRDDAVRWLVRWREDLTLARVLITQGRGSPASRALIKALELLESLHEAIEREGRIGNVIEVLMLQALARQAQGDEPSAFQLLGRALILSEPEGFVRLFVNEGEPLAALLRKIKVESKKMKAYRAKLLAAFRTDSLLTSALSPILSTDAGPAPQLSSLLDDPLSARELEVLRLMDTGLSNREIAEKAVVSLNTIKTQVKSIYSKLGVRSRDEALAVARALHLI
jgi:LuxR family maltose regulon positive regulatory protein